MRGWRGGGEGVGMSGEVVKGWGGYEKVGMSGEVA